LPRTGGGKKATLHEGSNGLRDRPRPILDQGDELKVPELQRDNEKRESAIWQVKVLIFGGGHVTARRVSWPDKHSKGG